MVAKGKIVSWGLPISLRSINEGGLENGVHIQIKDSLTEKSSKRFYGHVNFFIKAISPIFKHYRFKERCVLLFQYFAIVNLPMKTKGRKILYASYCKFINLGNVLSANGRVN